TRVRPSGPRRTGARRCGACAAADCEARRCGDHAGRRIDRHGAGAAGCRARVGGAGTLMRVSAPADERFRRAQVRPIRRRPWWRPHWRRVVLAAALLAAVGYGARAAAMFAAESGLLTVTRITVDGTV